MDKRAIANGCVVTMNAGRKVLPGGTVLISGSRIEGVLPAEAAVPEGYERIDARGCAVLPGLVNAHTHLYSALGRSLSFNEELTQWLETQKGLIAQFDDEDFAACIEVGLALNLRSGNTCVVDAMALPADAAHRYPVALDLAERYCLQYTLARAYTDQRMSSDYIENVVAIERSVSELIETYHGASDGRLRLQLFPNMAWALSIEGFRMTRRLADKYGIGMQMHTAESPAYPVLIEKAYGHGSDVRVYQQGGCLGPDVQLLSCAHLGDEDFEIIARTGTRVILDPISGTTIGTGLPPTLRVMGNGNPTALATNGMASAGGQDMFEAMKTLLSLARVEAYDPLCISAMRALEMATIEGARALGLDSEIGSLEPGKRADVICVQMDQLYQAPALDVPATLVFSCNSRDVRDVFANGQWVVRDRKLLVADEAALADRAAKRASAAWARTHHAS
ncbi:hypothetical protein CSC67_14565 [Pusillimonas caeni]|uniref:amidohydrolase family protein n=1 Tax=Pusillimonas caeni TaxID=1348472 RepID=UPI000E59B0FE|nr:amidohydrolase family protein [Pusillimonas caeni]TFL13116.1 hypothetical protein CSC67_14565 [Pusillimonas caeni]